jgi:N-acetylmuramoyl-L-alanine amidase
LSSTSIKPFKPDSSLVTRVHPAHNTEPRRDGARPNLVILHYTGMASAEKAIDWLARAESRVSCHYVVDEDGEMSQLVSERQRAWHAGISYWKGETDINSHSIGIEIHNVGHSDGYPDFPRRQIAAVIALTRDICARNGIRPEGVLAHSDVAVARKIDPGEKFPWSALARAHVGLWVRPTPVRDDDAGLGIGARGADIDEAQRLLAAFGYNIKHNGALDDAAAKVITAFQRHFRPKRIDGRLDRSTLTTLRRLVARTGTTV